MCLVGWEGVVEKPTCRPHLLEPLDPKSFSLQAPPNLWHRSAAVRAAASARGPPRELAVGRPSGCGNNGNYLQSRFMPNKRRRSMQMTVRHNRVAGDPLGILSDRGRETTATSPTSFLKINPSMSFCLARSTHRRVIVPRCQPIDGDPPADYGGLGPVPAGQRCTCEVQPRSRGRAAS